MANHKSSEKRARQTIVINKRNREYLSAVKTRIKAFYEALAEHKPLAEIENVYKTVQSSLAKAGQKGRIHKNNAARKIGRLAATLAQYKISDKDETAPTTSAVSVKKKVSTKAAPAKKVAKKAKATASVKKKKVAKKAPVKKTASKKKK